MRELLGQVTWRQHLFALTRFGIAIVFMVMAGLYFFESRQALNDAIVRHDSQIYLNDSAEASVDTLRTTIDDYVEYMDRGYVGEPQRLQWAESFREVAGELDLPGVEFTLESSKVTEQYIDPFWHPELKIRATGMKVTMQLRHEGSLYEFLEEVAARANGIYSIDSCGFRWLDASVEEFRTTRLRGECQLTWYTVAAVSDSWAEG